MRLFKPLLVALLVSAFSVPAFADESSNPGSGNRGFTLNVAYDGSYLHYRETYPGSTTTLDKDTGWMNGVNAEVRFETRRLWTRAVFDYSGTNNATYDGALWDGTPYSSDIKEWFTRYEGCIGYKLFDDSTSTITPYGGVGYRSWKRGEDVLPDYLEKYTWWYGTAGLNWVWRHDRWLFGVDAAALIPFSMRMKTDVAGQYDKATFKLKTRVGAKVEVPVTFDFYRAESGSYKFFAFVTPYYQYWEIGASDPVLLTSNGTPMGYVLEPDSTTDMYGANVGIGVNF